MANTYIAYTVNSTPQPASSGKVLPKNKIIRYGRRLIYIKKTVTL